MFNLQETALAKVLIKVLGLEKSEDGTRLVNWKAHLDVYRSLSINRVE
jgi:hypothetical protein